MDWIRFSSRMQGKRQMAEELAKQDGAVLVRPNGTFRWDGKRWRKIREPGPIRGEIGKFR